MWDKLDKKLKEKLLGYEKGGHDYLMPLFEYSFDLRAKTIFEFGVEDGKSTITLLSSCTIIGEKSHLWSLDIEPCKEAQELVYKLGLERLWSFIQIDDIEFRGRWDKPIDLLFIDTDHTLEHTTQELNCYALLIRKGGLIIMHDTLDENCGVKPAINDFLRKNEGEWEYKETPNIRFGLGVLKRA